MRMKPKGRKRDANWLPVRKRTTACKMKRASRASRHPSRRAARWTRSRAEETSNSPRSVRPYARRAGQADEHGTARRPALQRARARRRGGKADRFAVLRRLQQRPNRAEMRKRTRICRRRIHAARQAHAWISSLLLGQHEDDRRSTPARCSSIGCATDAAPRASPRTSCAPAAARASKAATQDDYPIYMGLRFRSRRSSIHAKRIAQPASVLTPK